jgi:hypothetical protein
MLPLLGPRPEAAALRPLGPRPEAVGVLPPSATDESTEAASSFPSY